MSSVAPLAQVKHQSISVPTAGGAKPDAVSSGFVAQAPARPSAAAAAAVLIVPSTAERPPGIAAMRDLQLPEATGSYRKLPRAANRESVIIDVHSNSCRLRKRAVPLELETFEPESLGRESLRARGCPTTVMRGSGRRVGTVELLAQRGGDHALLGPLAKPLRYRAQTPSGPEHV